MHTLYKTLLRLRVELCTNHLKFDLLVPTAAFEAIGRRLEENGAGTLRYSRVFMSLLDILSGEFFNDYIKRGNILMRSGGRPKVDNIFYIHSGTLHLELDRATYERCGLVGEPIYHGGRKHVKQRFLVTCNLRLPSMLHGKKGFERIVRAAQDVLIGDLEWVFADLARSDPSAESPIKKFHPFEYEVDPSVNMLEDAVIPDMPSMGTSFDLNYAEEMLEWIGLACAKSPRICKHDEVDSFLCRYQGPQTARELVGSDTQTQEKPLGLVHLRWRGLGSPKWVKDVFSIAEKISIEKDAWMVLCVTGFGGQSYTVSGVRGKEWLCWQCED